MSEPFVHHVELHIMCHDYIYFRYYYGDMRELRAMLDELFHWEDCFYQDIETGNSGHMFNR